MKNDKLSLINALHEVKINSWAREVAKVYNISEQEVKDLYETNLQTAYDYLNSLNEEGKRGGGILDPALNWLFGKKKIGAAPEAPAAAPPAAAPPGVGAPTPAEIRARAQEKTIDDLAAAVGAKRAKKPNDDLNPPASRPAADIKPTDLRAKYAKGPKEDPTMVGKGQPAADLKAGDMRSQFAKGPPTGPGVAKADADFNATSKAIGARRAAEKSASEINMPKSSMGNMKAKADTDVRTAARTDAEVKAKRDATMSDTAKKVAKGLAGAGALGAASYLLTKDSNNQNPAQAGGMDAATRAKSDLAMKVAGVERGNPIAKVGVLPQGNLKLGSRGDRVKQLQTELGIKADGIFGKGTKEALAKAQQGLGIQVDSEYGTQTQSAMQRAKGMSDLRGANRQLTKTLPGTSAETPVAQRMFQKNYNRDRMESTEYSSNRLIEGFKNIMSSGSPNLFEAAKKAKKDWDKDGKRESPKDEVWGSRFRAAGIQKEESEAEKAKKNPMSHEKDAGTLKKPLRQLTPDEMPVSKVERTGKQSSTAYKIKEEIEISEARESFTKGTRKIKTYSHGDYHAEVRHNPDWQEYQVHFYKNGKHMGEGPVSYHGEDKEDAHDSAKAGLEFLNKRNTMSESVSFSEAELAHLSSIDEANPIAPVPDDYSGAAGGVSIRDLSDETVAEGIRGMKRKDTKFKDDPKKYSNEYPKSFREPGTMSKSEMRDHIEASVRRYLRSGGKIKKS
jgi:hypothetical protein